MRVRRLRIPVGRLDPVAFDRLLAVLLLVLGELQIWLGDPAPHEPWASVFLTLPVYAALALRRRFPAGAGIAAQAIVSAEFAVTGGVEVISYSIAWGCAIYGLTVWTTSREFAVGLAFVCASNLAAAAVT